MNWRDHILSQFAPRVARLTLVADPDGLLLEEELLTQIRERGFELIPFEDHVAFRYAYETQYRSTWDRGQDTELVVVLRSARGCLDSLPYDLLQGGRKLSFNIGELFPSLSYPVIMALEKSELDALYHAQQQYTPGELGDNATKDFILRHVFEVAPELIKQPSDLLRVLLRRHFKGISIPEVLDHRLIEVLRKNEVFNDWPLEQIVADRALFYSFLQERWPVFLERLAARPSVREARPAYNLKIVGPMDLPFDHDDVRVYIDNLFVEGMLEPISHTNAASLSKTWAAIGIHYNAESDRQRRLESLLSAVETSIPGNNARHLDWFRFAQRFAELLALHFDPKAKTSKDMCRKVNTIRNQIDTSFMEWVTRFYASLINLPPVPPVMLHHVPRLLSRFVTRDSDSKVALVVVDGLSLDQWIVIREALSAQRRDLRFREHSVFAWAPTLTSVSRQALFAGKPPLFFPDTIQTTNKEATLWTQFWIEQGLSRPQVGYIRGVGNGDNTDVDDLISSPQAKVIGLVIDKIDKIMHGMELGSSGMHNQIDLWLQEGFLVGLLDDLLANGFSVFLTSDHGNIEAVGCGQPAEGVIADLRGQRARIYSDQQFRGRISSQFPGTIEWNPVGLPEDYLPLLASGRTAFVRQSEKIVGHGGVSIEELIVPFIRIERHEGE